MVTICQEFGWDFYTYMAQPTWFLQIIKEKMLRDDKEAQMKMKGLKKK